MKKIKGKMRKAKAPRETNRWLLASGLVVIVLAAYWPALNGGPVWDDDAHLTRRELRSWAGLCDIWFHLGSTRQYYPVIHSCFWLGNAFWGQTALPYHLINVLLHATSALLLVAILQKLRIPGAWLAGAIFALHPVHVESVAWISELKNVLSGFFYFSAALLYLQFDQGRQRSRYLFALGLFLLGLLSKSVIATLPMALLLVFWWQRGSLSWKRDVMPLLPFLFLGVASGLFTTWVERHFIGAEGRSFDFSLIERGLIAGRVFWFYLSKLFWPAELIFIYPRWSFNDQVWWQYLFPLAATLLVGLLWWFRQRTHALLVGILIFAGTLVPVLGFVNVYPFIYSFVADHFQYIASVGIIVPFAAGVALGLQRYGHLAIATSFILPGVLGVLTWKQAHLYQNAEILYSATLTRNPACWLAHNNLGLDLMAKGRIKEAVAHYQEAIGIDPDNAHAYSNLGNALMLEGRAAEAARNFEHSLQLAPTAVQPKNNLAWLLATSPQPGLRNPARAVLLAEEAVATSESKDPVILRTLATSYAQSGRYAEANATAEKGLSLLVEDEALSVKLRAEAKLYRFHLSQAP